VGVEVDRGRRQRTFHPETSNRSNVAALAWSLAETRMKVVCLEHGDWI